MKYEQQFLFVSQKDIAKMLIIDGGSFNEVCTAMLLTLTLKLHVKIKW